MTRVHDKNGQVSSFLVSLRRLYNSSQNQSGKLEWILPGYIPMSGLFYAKNTHQAWTFSLIFEQVACGGN